MFSKHTCTGQRDSDHRAWGWGAFGDLCPQLMGHHPAHLSLSVSSWPFGESGPAGVIRSLHNLGRLKHVFCTETRPYNQGARLTAFELVYEQIPATLITDSMAAAAMAHQDVSGQQVGCQQAGHQHAGLQASRVR